MPNLNFKQDITDNQLNQWFMESMKEINELRADPKQDKDLLLNQEIETQQKYEHFKELKK